MKKSVKIRLVCLIVAAVMLGGAATVAAVMGSPYETLKKALLDAMTFRNTAEETLWTVTVNGVTAEVIKRHTIQGDNSSIRYDFDNDGNADGYHYQSDNLSINPLSFAIDGKMEYNTGWYSAYIYSRNSYYSGISDFAVFRPEDRHSAQLRFYELLLDALVGDLKNNITMTSSNGIRYIQGTLTESQVPELAKAGIDLAIEQSGNYYNDSRDISFDGNEYIFEYIYIDRGVKTVLRWKQNVRPMTTEEMEAWDDGIYHQFDEGYWGVRYIGGEMYIGVSEQELINEYKAPATRADYMSSDNPLDLPMQSLVINYVHGEAEVDMDGNLLYIEANGTVTVTNIFGDVSVVEVKATARFSDIGTSNPACPIPGAEQLLTSDYVKERFGSRDMNVYFKLKEDGSIDADSVTTMYPGELVAMDNPYSRYDPYPKPVPMPAEYVIESYVIESVEAIDGVEIGVDADAD